MIHEIFRSKSRLLRSLRDLKVLFIVLSTPSSWNGFLASCHRSSSHRTAASSMPSDILFWAVEAIVFGWRDLAADSVEGKEAAVTGKYGFRIPNGQRIDHQVPLHFKGTFFFLRPYTGKAKHA